MAEEQKNTVLQAVSDLKTLTARINEMCVSPRVPDSFALQTLSKSSGQLIGVAKSKMSVMDVVLRGGALSSIAFTSKWTQSPLAGITLGRPSVAQSLVSSNIAKLASLEAKTGVLACSQGITKLTSVASQITSISDVIAPQSRFIRELIAPTSMLSDLQRMAENTHETILNKGNLDAWQLGVLDSASFMVDRHVDWASRFCTATYEEEPLSHFKGMDDYAAKVNVIEHLPIELENEHSRNKDIAPSTALEMTPSFQMSEQGKGLVEKIVNINKTCQRKKIEKVFKYTNATMIAATNLGGTVCTNNSSFGSIIDGLYFFFYENLKHIKELFSEDAVRNEDIFQCIFRVKDMRTDLRHDFEHGDNIGKKMNDIAESYSFYTGKVTLTATNDFLTIQEGLYKDFSRLLDHLQETIEGRS